MDEPPIIPFVSYRPFPPVIQGYFILDINPLASLTLKLCDATSTGREPLFMVEVNTGLIPSKLLGMKVGHILHNGPSYKDPTLSATCSKSFWSGTWSSSKTTSLIILPPVHPNPNATRKDMVKEKMVTVTPGGGEGLTYRLSLVIGKPGEERIEAFEWLVVFLYHLTKPTLFTINPRLGKNS